MPFRLLCFFTVQFFLLTTATAQPGDTILSGNDSNRILRMAEKEAQRWRDSMDAIRIKNTVKEKGKSLEAFLNEMKEREQARKRQEYIRVGALAILFAALIVSFLRRRKKD